jgi:hypothetical protein
MGARLARRALVVSLAFLASFVAAQSPNASLGLTPNVSPKASVARELLDQARQYSGVGDWETASSCLAEAAIDDPTDADVLYLSALASVKRSEPLALALGRLDGALATGRFMYYGKWDARILKAELLVRECRWRPALDTLGNPDPIALADPAYALVRARALALSGDGRAFAQAIADALRRFPDDTAVARLFLLRSGRFPSSDTARMDLATILGRLSSYTENDPELPVLAAPYMETLAARKDAVLAYRALGQTSASATLRALEYGIVGEGAAAAELLSGAYPITLADLDSLYALAGSPEGRKAVHEALSAWSGKVLVDADSDGVYEGSISLDKGLVTLYERDSHQEGEVDESAVFSDGLPSSLRLSRPSLILTVVYSRYPAVSSVSFEEKGETRTYSFAPEAFSFAPMEMRLFSGSGKSALYLPRAVALADPSEKSCLVAALSVETKGGELRKLVLLEGGKPISAVSYEGDRVYSTTVYERGAPVLERVDADGDGRFETERGFVLGEDGQWKIAWMRTDENGNGIYEYYEQFVPPFTKEWDFEGNGNIDARSITLSDGSIQTQYSSRLDGKLDETLIVKGGKIVSLIRRGMSIALIADENKCLTWIGTKEFDLGGNLPNTDGIYIHRGKRYRLTRVGSLSFAELIP